ncbi:MAG: IS3 family transposase [Bacillota bacterium]
MAKYTYEQRLRAVLDVTEKHMSYRAVTKLSGCAKTHIQRWVKRYEQFGVEGLILKHGTYTGEFKQHVVEYMHKNHLSICETAVIFGIPGDATVGKWERIYYEEGPQALYNDNRGRKNIMSSDKPKKEKLNKETEEDLIAEVQRLRMENAYLKKFKCLSSGKNCPREWEKVTAIRELRHEFKLMDLLKFAGMPRSTFYYYLKRLNKPDKYEDVKTVIKEIYHANKGRYGYRRITLELHNRGYIINHKTVLKLMKECNVKCQVRLRRYRSYKGEVGKIAPNILQRDFKADKPNQKWVTDVTEFSLFGTKLYLSPILDLFNGEIISHSISERPTFDQTMDMLDKAFAKIPDNTKLILHSDQGWQYQMKRYQNRLQQKGIVQSMSRKGNCYDNSVMENFFGLMKSELLYLQTFSSVEHFRKELEDYIEYYNNKRIKCKLKGLSPVQYRIQSTRVA